MTPLGEAVPAATRITSGRYVVYHAGRECGEERWRIEATAEGALATGEHVLEPPHPFPSRHEWRARLTRAGRLEGLEILWSVGERRLRAVHAADGGRWRARIEYGGRVHEQEGDYPAGCEVDFLSPLFLTFMLARRDFALEGEHEFPVLRIGPPWMAVTPARMLIRCVEIGRHAGARGVTEARRYVVGPPRPAGGAGDEAEAYTLWADESGLVLETHQGIGSPAPWMKLVEIVNPPRSGWTEGESS